MSDNFDYEAGMRAAVESLSKTSEEYKRGLQRQSRYIMLLSIAVVVLSVIVAIVTFTKTRPTRQFLATMPDGRLVEVRTFATPLDEDVMRIQFVENVVASIHSLNWRNIEDVLSSLKKRLSPSVYANVVSAVEGSDEYRLDVIGRDRLSSRAIVESVRNLTPGISGNQVFAMRVNKEVFKKGILVNKKRFYVYVELSRAADLDAYPFGWMITRYTDSPKAMKIDQFLKKRERVRL